MDRGMEQDSFADQMAALNERLLGAYLTDLQHESPARRRRAARAIANLGDVGTRAIPALRKALADRDKKVREAVALALERLDREAPCP